MANIPSGQQGQKKPSLGGFLLIALTFALLIWTLQGVNSGGKNPVTSRDQLEHLVNLDLIKDRQKEVAGNNFVNFTGHFKDQIAQENRSRYDFLKALADKNKEITQKTHLERILKDLAPKVLNSVAQLYALTGDKIPEGGETIIDHSYDRGDVSYALELDKTALKPMKIMPLSVLEKKVSAGDDQSSLKESIGRILDLMVSSNLNLRKEFRDKVQLLKEGFTGPNTLEQNRLVVAALRGIVNEVSAAKDGVSFIGLGYVNSYQERLVKLDNSLRALKDAEKRLEISEASPALPGTWFFNGQSLTTDELKKISPDKYAAWFVGAENEWNHFNQNRSTAFKLLDQAQNTAAESTFESKGASQGLLGYLIYFFPVLLVMMLLYMVFAKQMKGGAAGAMTFGKSTAKLLTPDKGTVKFKDVAGAEESKAELEEVVNFLKDPHKFQRMGAKIPRGVLLVGSPGTGKTLLAKAVAGEAGVPFFFISGSDFVEMFVGVGASRVRDLFDQAKKHAPCIIFIDEIDAVGRARGAGLGGGHDEREQTLNQLLIEMDGFESSTNIILIAATNRPDVLDKALLRPGRFDRQVTLDLPDVKGRLAILNVHAKKILLGPNVDLFTIAQMTVGSSGADLANILNEAALLAATRGLEEVNQAVLLEATDKVRYGKERTSLERDEKERSTTAYHEAGHAIVALNVKHSEKVTKVTIVPRGQSLGATHFTPTKNRLGYWREELVDQLAILMGGRAAEEIFVGSMSSGAQQDIAQATNIIRAMACQWGMFSELGVVAYQERNTSGQYLGGTSISEKAYSDETALKIDAVVLNAAQEALVKAKEVLEAHRDQVELMVKALMQFDSIGEDKIKAIREGTYNLEEEIKSFKDIQSAKPVVLPPPPPSV